MLTKEYICDIKKQGNVAIQTLLKSSKDEKSLLLVLENLGRLPDGFDDTFLKKLLTDGRKKIRLSAVKNIGKTKNDGNIPLLSQIATNDEFTDIRREAVSSMGRMRSRKAISALIEILEDRDPKIISQAIRGLLIFKGTPEIDKKLMAFSNHENETIQDIISKAYFIHGTPSKKESAHCRSPAFLKNVVVLGDVREILQSVPDGSFHLIFTSPPYYNARDYSIYPSYKAYLEFLKEVFRVVFYKTKEGRFLIVNTSPIIIPRISRQHSSKRYSIPFDIHNFLTEMDWEFVDDIIWVKTEASVKNRNAGFLQHRKPLAYKPNARTEYLMVYRKKTDKLIDWNIRQYEQDTIEKSKVEDGYETSNVWEIDPTFSKVHSAVFPLALCKRIIQYYSFEGDLIFDPFAGSGTFGLAAQYLNRSFFLTERENKYFEYMKKTLSQNTLENIPDNNSSKFFTLQQFKTLRNEAH